MRVDMKLMFGLVVVIAVASALPAQSRSPQLGRVELEQDAEEIPVPESGIPENPVLYDGFLGGFSDMFERMRQQMLYLLSHVPRIGFGSPDEGNTTSVTKIIDGHKVTINETVYSSGNGEDTAAVFKVRVVDIQPDTSDSSSPGVERFPSGPKGSVESLEISNENEIPKSLKVHQQKRKVNNMDYLDDEYNNLETFDDGSNELDTYDGLETFDDDNIDNAANTGLETFDEDNLENSIENEIELGHDLSNDIRINKIAEQYGKTTNPDAEFVPNFELHQPQPPRDLSRDIFVNEIARNQGRRPHPDAEIFDPSAPISNNVYDLSRDTYVNEIGNLPVNPDAEFIGTFPNSRYYYRTENS